MQGRRIADGRVRVAVGTLLFATVVCLAMIVWRMLFTQEALLKGFAWNLALAWVPLLFSLRVHTLDAHPAPRWWAFALWTVPWFLFFPNAPYIVTDLLHLKTRPPIPMWFDLVMMVSFAWTGLLLGYLSLFLMQEVVRRRTGRAWSWSFAGAMLALSSFGIYLGRFERWNSWDVLTRPLGLAGDIVSRLNFLSHPEMTAFCLTFFAFSLLSYATLYALTHLQNSAPAPDPAAGG